MSSRSSRLTIWRPSTSDVNRARASRRDDSQVRSEHSLSTHGASMAKNQAPQQTEYSPLHMRLLNCPGGTCPSMAMRLEMELEYAERRAKCIRRSQAHNAPRLSGELQARKVEGTLLSGVSPLSDTEETTIRRKRQSLLSKTTAAAGSLRRRSPGPAGRGSKQDVSKSRFLTSSDAISDDVSTCAGTGSLQSVINLSTPLNPAPRSIVKPSHEILPLTRSCRRRQCVPKPRARAATKADRLCPPMKASSHCRFSHAPHFNSRRGGSDAHRGALLRHRTCSPTRARGATNRMQSPVRGILQVAKNAPLTVTEPRATLRVTRTTRHAIQQPVADPHNQVHQLMRSHACSSQCPPPQQELQNCARQISSHGMALDRPSYRRRNSSLCTSLERHTWTRQVSSQFVASDHLGWKNQGRLQYTNVDSPLLGHGSSQGDSSRGCETCGRGCTGRRDRHKDLSASAPGLQQTTSTNERRQRMRRFKSCTSVGILSSLVRRHARKLVGGKLASHEGSIGADTEVESVMSASPQYNSTMANLARAQTTQEHLMHRSTESASSSLYMPLSHGADVLKPSLTDYSGSRTLKHVAHDFSRYKTIRQSDTDSESGAEEEDYTIDDDDDDDVDDDNE